jgi:hypothetical protein
MKRPVFFIIFAATYPILYVIAFQKNYALFTYHPALAEFGWGAQAPKDGPAMYFYGWMATAAIAAFVLAIIMGLVPRSVSERLSPNWAWLAPLAVLVAFPWLLRSYFLH